MPLTTEPTLRPERASEEVKKFLQAIPDGQCKLISSDGKEYEFPPEVFAILHSCAAAINQGASFFALSGLQQMTTMAAAEILGMSRPHLIKLLDKGEIPFSTVGKHRRLIVKDVLEYKASRKAKRRRAMDEFADSLGEHIDDR